LKIIGRPPVPEIKPIRETRQPRPDIEIKRVSLPPVRLQKESVTIKRRVVAPTKEKSVFRPGIKPAPLKNIVKEKELEQWVAPKRVKAPQADVAPAAKKILKRDEQSSKPAPPAAQVHQVQTPAVQVREVKLPAGKTRFKRVAEPQGEANVAPVRTIVPEAQPQGGRSQDSSDEGPKNGKTQGRGKNK
jgi:hypothetical protein